MPATEPTYPGGMGRSPFTLAAAVTAALPGADVTGARTLSAGGDGRFDSAVATLADGRELAIRVADDDDAARELAGEALALRALTAGARAMLPFAAPAYVGETRVGDGRALVTGLLPGFQIEAADVPPGRGAAESMGGAIAAVHALPTSVVRGAGLPGRTADESRDEIARLIDAAASTGRVPARLTVRWREAADDDDLWRFEAAVVLGGVQSTSFLFEDDPEQGPRVTGLVGWHGLSLGDPAIDLAWLSSAPEAAADVHAAYAAAAGRVPDAALEVRARLLAELEFARWLVHGDSLRLSDVVDDAAALLESLAAGLHADDLTVIARRGEGVDSAMDALGRVPVAPTGGIDTSMQTDAYNPHELWPADDPQTRDDDGDADGGGREADTASDGTSSLNMNETQPLLPLGDPDAAELGDPVDPARSERAAVAGAGGDPDDRAEPADEAQRAARAALQRWKSSASE